MNYLWFDWLLLRIVLIRKTVAGWGVGIARITKRPFRSRSGGGFQVRSAERDGDTDRDSVISVAAALDLALQKVDAERAGLKRRIDDVVCRAAIVGGNDVDDYLTRADDRAQMLRASDAEIRRGQGRLTALDQNVSHFKFLRAALQTRFPDARS